ncbi:hypothetical protein DRN46_02965 [Thermococci archaeon]|nr:MAG: hypothetical protein DRN46_02965 [Thermococci archaeon]
MPIMALSERDTRLMILSAILANLAWGLFSVIFQLYMKEIGYTSKEIGEVLAIYGISLSSVALPSGAIADRFGRKSTLIVGYLLEIISLLLLLISKEMSIIRISFLFSGISAALSHPAYQALFALHTREMERGFSSLAFFSTFSSSMGSLMGWIPEVLSGKLGELRAYYLSLLIVFSFFVLSVVPLIWVSPHRDELKEGRRKERTSFRRIYREKAMLKLIFLNGVIGFGAGLTIPLFTYYFSEKFSVGPGPIGTLYTVNGLMMSPLFLLSSRLSDKLGLIKAIFYPQLFSIPALALIPLSKSFEVASILYVYRTAMMNMSNPLITTLGMKLTKEEIRATFSAAFQLSWTVLNSIGTLLGGKLMASSLDAPLYATSSIYLVYLALFLQLMTPESTKLKEKA